MIDDRELVLYVYRDGLSSARTRAIERELEVDAGLRQRLAELEKKLNQLRPAPTPAPPSAHRRWHAALAEVSDCEAPKRVRRTGRPVEPGPWWLLFPARALMPAGLALVLALGVVIGLHLSPPRSPDGPAPTAATVPTEPAVANAMAAYLAETERQLVSLGELAAEERSALVGEIVARNRLYVKAAERAEWPELARVLRAFGIALGGFGYEARADQPNEELRAQLSFELNALQTRIDRRSSNQTTTI